MSKAQTILFFIFQFLLCLILLYFFSGWVFPFTTDSVIYVSTADHIHHNKGLLFSNFFIQPPELDSIPTWFAPPGYPILIVVLKFLGINEYTASLTLPHVGFLLLPFLFFMVFTTFMPTTVACLASFVCTFMFSTLKCSLIAWSDVPYLCFSLFSLVAVFRIIAKKTKVAIPFILLAGALSGFSVLVRFVGVTLVASIVTGLIVMTVMRLISVKDFIKTITFYGLGVFMTIAPYLLRNLLAFGVLQPYNTPPSNVPLLTNLHDYLNILAEMIFTHYSFAAVIVMIIAGGSLWFIFYFKKSIKIKQGQLIYPLILFIYFFYGSIFLIAYKTIYYGPEPIDDRYLLQVAWIMMGGLVHIFYLLLKKLDSSYTIGIRLITILLLLVFILAQIFPAMDFYFSQKKIKALATKIQHHIPLVEKLPVHWVIVSNVVDMTYYFSKRNTRMLRHYTPYDLLNILGSKRRFVVFLVKELEFSSPSWEYARWWWRNPSGYYRAFSDKDLDLFVPIQK